MKIDREQVLDTLKTIIHPSAEKDIVIMGMVQNLTIKKNKLKLDLVFTSAQDPLKSSLKRACEITLKDRFPTLEEIAIIIQTPLKPLTSVVEERILPQVKNIVAISSGKGGVGKSTVASNLALAFAGEGMKTGLIDADIFGPSIPRMLGLEESRPRITKIEGKDKIMPVERFGIKVLSIGFFIDKEDATVWRGPMASNALKQLITDAEWGELDYLFVDLPPGTSDIHLTLVQTVSVTGAIIVSTPQPVALADVIKGINMFRNDTINVPVLGLIENMSWFTPEELPENRYYIFGKNGCAELARKMNVPLLGQIPLVQSVREGGDSGEPVVLHNSEVSHIYKSIAESLRIQVIKRNTDMQPTRKVEITRKKYSDLK